MKFLVAAGVILIILSAVALAYQGFSYTDEETVLDIGPLEATAETTETVPIPPILGWIGLVVGIILLVAGVRRTA